MKKSVLILTNSEETSVELVTKHLEGIAVPWSMGMDRKVDWFTNF